MDRIHARYPFLDSARQAVEEANVDLLEVVQQEPSVVRRGTQRVTTGLSEGHIGSENRSTRVELLSYPVARVLVSMLDEPMAIDTYARAEAATARERFEQDIEQTTQLKSTRNQQIGLQRLLNEFGLADSVDRIESGYLMTVPSYLRLSRNLDEERWRLVERSIHAGDVPIDRSELLILLEEAVAMRVEDGLPLTVPEPIETSLREQQEEIENLITDHNFSLSFDTVNETAFPPCMIDLLKRAREGEALSLPGQFALVAFLGSMGLDAERLTMLVDGGLDQDAVEYQLARIQSSQEGVYAPPSCASMQSYGLCVNRDERCDQINHPVEYYEKTLKEQ